MLMNANTRIVTTKLNGNAYYDYDNKIYHWAMTGVDPVVPAEGAKPDITLPDGEQIMDICTNAVPYRTDDPPGTARSASGLPLAGGPDRFSGTAGAS